MTEVTTKQHKQHSSEVQFLKSQNKRLWAVLIPLIPLSISLLIGHLIYISSLSTRVELLEAKIISEERLRQIINESMEPNRELLKNYGVRIRCNELDLAKLRR